MYSVQYITSKYQFQLTFNSLSSTRHTGYTAELQDGHVIIIFGQFFLTLGKLGSDDNKDFLFSYTRFLHVDGLSVGPCLVLV